MKRKIIVLSIDAMVHEDVAYMETKPNFQKLMGKRAEVIHNRTIYPTQTYPAHASIISGCYPGKTGISFNQPMKTFKDGYSHWWMRYDDNKAENLFAAAKRAGCTTASIFWPTTCFDPNIDWCIGENFHYFPQYETYAESIQRWGANEEAMEIVHENMFRVPEHIQRGEYAGLHKLKRYLFDDFLMGCACSMIRKHQPDFMMIHYCKLDSLRHVFGTFSKETKDAMDHADMWLGEIIKALEEVGVYDDTDFVIVSDHGQMDFDRYVRTNVLLKNGGFIDLAPDGSVYGYRAFTKSNNFSSCVCLADPTNEKVKQEVYEYLLKLKDEGCYGIGEVLTADELRERYHYYGPFEFVLESDGKTVFRDDFNKDIFFDVKDDPNYTAKHGYMPEKGPQPVFLAAGPDFKAGAVLPLAHVTDIAPTVARVLGQEMPMADGRVLEELLNV